MHTKHEATHDEVGAW